MNNFIITLIIIGFVLISYWYIGYLKVTRGTEGYAKRKATGRLFLGFMALIGITTVFADALFEFLGLTKPANFEWLAFAAYVVFALATVFIMKRENRNTSEITPPAKTPQTITTINQTHNGSGDNTAGDKIVHGDKVTGIKTVINYPSKKKDKSKELTFLHTINPKNIIGRKDDLSNLHQLLSDNKEVVVVNGMGGIGKTTLAAAYAFEYYDHYEYIAWITQNDTEDIKNDFVQNNELQNSLDIETIGKEPNQIFMEMLMALNAISKRPKLFIIDNATPSIEKYFDYLPTQPNWHLLITARAQIEGFTPLQLGFLSEPEAIQLFQKYCKRIKDASEIKSIVKTVDYHTLTIEILAKTAEKQRTDITKLLEAIKNDLKANIKTNHSQDDKVERISSYLMTCFDLSRLNEDEIWLLQQFACLPTEFQPYELLEELIQPEATKREDVFSETLEELVSKGWLIKEEDNYKMHRIIGEILQKKIKTKIEHVAPLISRVSAKLKINQTKDNPIDKFKWIPYGNALLVFADTNIVAPNIATLLNNLATVLQDLGDYKGAKALLEKATRSAEKNFGEGHPTTAIRYSNLATVLKGLGDYEGAKELLEKATKSNEKSFGETHPHTARSYSNLALVLQDLGDYKGARALLEKATKSVEKNFGESHPATAISYSNLALVLKDLGDYKGAKELLEKATKSVEKNFGESHPTTAIRYSNLAAVLQDLEELDQAKFLSKKAVDIFKNTLPPGHPHIINAEEILKSIEEEIHKLK